MKHLIGVNSNCYHGYSIEDAIAGIHAAGFKYIELTATKGWTEHVFPEQSFSRLLQIQKLMEKNELIPFAMSGHCNLMDVERQQDFIENIKLAAFFGCRYIVSSVGEAHLNDRQVAAEEKVGEYIVSLLPLLEKNHMKLVLETHGDHGTGAKLKKIIDMVHSDFVKINYDTANAIFWGGTDPVSDLSACVSDVAYMHIKDKAGEQKEWNFPALGEGCIDFRKLFEILDKNQNGCPLSIEIEFTEAGAGSLKNVDRAVRKSYEYLEKLGIL